MTITFVSLVLIQFFNAYNFRSERHSIVKKPFANRWLNARLPGNSEFSLSSSTFRLWKAPSGRTRFLSWTG